MAFQRLPGPLARMSSGARAALAVAGIALGVLLIVLGVGSFSNDKPADIPTTTTIDSQGAN